MKCAILAGGFGTRMGDETAIVPKPMLEIGGMPMLWHIMKLYDRHAIRDFIICLGYKSHVIKDFFLRYPSYIHDLKFDLRSGAVEHLDGRVEDWSVTFAETGLEAGTGGRIRKIRAYLREDEPFCLTYGDGLSDIDLADLVAFHKAHGRLATVTAVKQKHRFGVLGTRDDGTVTAMKEKPMDSGALINGGFFVLDPQVCDYIPNDDCAWEQEPLEALVRDGQLMAYEHSGFWQCMDTTRDKRHLEELWRSGDAPWKTW